MRCAICGFSNIHGAKFCSECGSPLQMQDAGKSARRNSDRKVIKLPSDMANEPTTPIERPWEVRVPKREADSPAQDNTASTTGAAASSAKGPTPRRRTGSTGRIPAIKHPANESGKIPVEERASTAAAKASTAGKPSPSDTSSTTSPRRTQRPPAPAHPRAPLPALDAARVMMLQARAAKVQARRRSSRSSLPFSSSAASWHSASSSRTRQATRRP